MIVRNGVDAEPVPRHEQAAAVERRHDDHRDRRRTGTAKTSTPHTVERDVGPRAVPAPPALAARGRGRGLRCGHGRGHERAPSSSRSAAGPGLLRAGASPSTSRLRRRIGRSDEPDDAAPPTAIVSGDHEDQQHRHRRAERPVLRRLELAGHELADHVALRAAEHGRGDVVAHERDEHEQHARDDAGRAPAAASRGRTCVQRPAPRSFDASRSGPPTRSNATNSGRIISGR